MPRSAVFLGSSAIILLCQQTSSFSLNRPPFFISFNNSQAPLRPSDTEKDKEDIERAAAAHATAKERRLAVAKKTEVLTKSLEAQHVKGFARGREYGFIGSKKQAIEDLILQEETVAAALNKSIQAGGESEKLRQKEVQRRRLIAEAVEGGASPEGTQLKMDAVLRVLEQKQGREALDAERAAERARGALLATLREQRLDAARAQNESETLLADVRDQLSRAKAGLTQSAREVIEEQALIEQKLQALRTTRRKEVLTKAQQEFAVLSQQQEKLEVEAAALQKARATAPPLPDEPVQPPKKKPDLGYPPENFTKYRVRWGTANKKW